MLPKFRIASLLEIAVILIVAVFATSYLLQEAIANTTPPGEEYPYLISSGAVASLAFRQNGAIPLWNPLMGHGEPLFENLMSYMFNPLMAFPILGWGAVVGGKTSILLHMVILALGGWALGRALKLGSGGTIVLALLLLGSGSFTSELIRGFYQMSLSLAYMPWVLAGLIGLLYGDQPRRWLAIFVVALTLMLFAGTGWFVLPTLMSCAVLAPFALIRPDSAAARAVLLKRLALAGGFFLGLSAIMMIPRLNTYLVVHPSTGLGSDTWDLLGILSAYFTPEKAAPTDIWFAYHFIVPAWFALAVVVVRLALARLKPPLARWRIFVPALIMIAFFSVWAQGNTPLFKFLYDNTPLVQWRWTVRIMAAASPLVAIVAAIWFDEALALLLQRRMVLRLGAIVLMATGLYAGWQVLGNWNTLVRFPAYVNTGGEYNSLVQLRQANPGALLPVLTEGLLPHVVAHDLGIRSSFGNIDLFTNGLPATLGTEGVMPSVTQFAIAYNGGYQSWLEERGYLPYPDAPLAENKQPALWYNPQALPYTFMVERSKLTNLSGKLTPYLVDPVVGMEHHLDQIDLTLGAYHWDSLLVVQEVDYPGWTVTIDGQPAQVESFDGYLAVLLPVEVHTVVFSYFPPLLVVGTLVYCLTLLLFAGYILHFDEGIKDTRLNPIPNIRSLAAWLRLLVRRFAEETADV